MAIRVCTCRCPYTPPHPLNLDFPHLVLRYRAVANAAANRPAAAVFNPVTDGDPERMGAAAGGMSMEGGLLSRAASLQFYYEERHRSYSIIL
jgi:hypothetical protein